MRNPVPGGQPVLVTDAHTPRKDPPAKKTLAHQECALLADKPVPKPAVKRRETAPPHHIDPLAPDQIAQEAERNPLRPTRRTLPRRGAFLAAQGDDSTSATPSLQSWNRDGVRET